MSVIATPGNWVVSGCVSVVGGRMRGPRGDTKMERREGGGGEFEVGNEGRIRGRGGRK